MNGSLVEKFATGSYVIPVNANNYIDVLECLEALGYYWIIDGKQEPATMIRGKRPSIVEQLCSGKRAIRYGSKFSNIALRQDTIEYYRDSGRNFIDAAEFIEEVRPSVTVSVDVDELMAVIGV